MEGSKEVMITKNEPVRPEDMKEGLIVRVSIKEGGSLAAAEILVLANVTDAGR